MNFTLANSLILAGIIQGFIFGAVYLLSKKYRSLSTALLAGLIITFSYNNLQFYLSDARIITGNEMYATFYIPVGSLIPVFIFLYVKSFLDNSVKISRRMLWLFTPFALFLMGALALKIDSMNDVNAVRKPIWQIVGNSQSLFSFGYTLILIAIAWKLVRNYIKKRLSISKEISKEVRWLQTMLAILFALSLFWGFALFKYMTDSSFRIYFTALWILLSLAIYWLGHIGIYKHGVRKQRDAIKSYSRTLSIGSFPKKPKNEHIVNLQGVLVGNQKYLDPKLTLQELSEELQLSKTYVSRVLNQELGMSFTDYVNSLRVEAAKANLKHPDFANYTLVAIGLESGFNSKTTFNSAFKKHTGMTPSQFRNNHKQLIEI